MRRAQSWRQQQLLLLLQGQVLQGQVLQGQVLQALLPAPQTLQRPMTAPLWPC